MIEFPVSLSEETLEDKEAFRKAKEAMVLEFLRKGEISQGKAAELLEISRYELVDLMAEHKISVFNYTKEELEEEMKAASKLKRELDAK
ncbi:Uncharacterized protein MCHI_001975 [Candidatus Magnetoovum chiemensis]|nr:Uncharacterized protein MCHI_001975 [Candidatus Magnetoovum chiemensis]